MWPQTPAELVRVQRELASARPAPWRAASARPLIVGCFVCFARGVRGRGAAGDRGWAAAALMRGNRQLAEMAIARGEAGAAYEPGLLALREGPLLEAALRALRTQPDVVIANATGRDHPRGAGLALHLGAALDLPSIGVSDRALLADGAQAPAERSAWCPLLLEGVEVARLVRTRLGARPIVVHAGWRTDLDTATSVALTSIRRARTPEPLRRARREARRTRAADERGGSLALQ